MVYVVLATKVGLQMVAVCENEELAKREALRMLEQQYAVVVIPTPMIEA